MKQECLTGGTEMFSIQFNNKEDLNFFYQSFLKNKSEHIQIERKSLQLDFIFPGMKKGDFLTDIYKHLKKFIMEKKRMEWCQEILENDFFYTDTDEQIQIIEMVYSIMEGKRKDLPFEIDHASLEEQLDQALLEVIRSSHILSIDAFITFRLRFYIEKLSSYLEIAIDEYKMEQDYQSFIFYLRNFLAERSAQMKCIYLVNEDGFQFYDEHKNKIKRSDLDKRIDRKLLSDHPVYVDSVTIAPLISIAPEIIYLYTEQPENGIIQTLKNIFEEKLIILSLQDFSYDQREK
ncbi:sporulation protein [Caldifermentibacillus hisashii]|nr:sporulation protein [Caldifermentibacillus hisashii]